MKKFGMIFSLVLASLVSVFACEYGADDGTMRSYIASVNFSPDGVHIPAASFASNNDFSVINGMRVSIPITLWFKIEPRVVTVGGSSQAYNIAETKLFYKIVKNGDSSATSTGKWRLAKQFNVWNNDKSAVTRFLSYDTPVKLFGNNTLTLDMIQKNGDTIEKNDRIIFVWYILDDGMKRNGPALSTGIPTPQFNVGNDSINTEYWEGHGYNPQYVLEVVYNGLKTP